MDAILEAEDVDVECNHPVNRGEQIAEVLVFLFLIVPNLVLSLFVIPAGGVSFSLAATTIMLRDLALVSLVLLFLRRNGEPLVRIGWRFANSWREGALGVGLFIPFFLGAALADSLFRTIGLSGPSTQVLKRDGGRRLHGVLPLCTARRNSQDLSAYRNLHDTLVLVWSIIGIADTFVQ
jgi:hypothetical protein